MDDLYKRKLNTILQLWFGCADPKQRAELARQAAELQAQWRGKKKPHQAQDLGGVQSDLEDTPATGGHDES